MNTKLRTCGPVLLFSLSIFASTAHGETAKWTASVVQGGQRLLAPGEVHIKKAPFTLVFTGPADFGFAVLAAADCTEIKPLTTAQSISEVIRPTNLAAEGKAEKNTFLVVNAPGAIKSGDNTAQVWADDAEADQHSFQVVQQDGHQQMTATREIREIIQYSSFKDLRTLPIAQYPNHAICILVTGLPPVGAMVHDSPKVIQVLFD